MTTRGEDLIFLVSQPRAGSTLLQRILGGHPEIHTLGEPWLMLPLLYALKPDGWEADYDAAIYRMAQRELFDALPGGEEDYLEGVRRMAAHLYERARAGSGKRLFLDKTPRYYLVLPELLRAFPRARFVILLRQPLAVLNSIVRAWASRNWFALWPHAIDLVAGPRLLLEGERLLGERASVVRYEALVAQPEETVRSLCQAMDLPYLAEMVEYGRVPPPRFQLGDQWGMLHHESRPTPRSLERWTEGLSHPQMWRASRDYLRLLGPETLGRMGYSYESLERTLAERAPGAARFATVPLRALLSPPAVTLPRRLLRRIARRALLHAPFMRPSGSSS